MSFLQQNGKAVLVPDDVPDFDFPPSQCLMRWFNDVKLLEDPCKEPLSQIEDKKSAWTSAIQTIEMIRGVQILKIERYFCEA